MFKRLRFKLLALYAAGLIPAAIITPGPGFVPYVPEWAIWPARYYVLGFAVMIGGFAAYALYDVLTETFG